MRGLLSIAKLRGIREGLYVLIKLVGPKVRPTSQSIQLLKKVPPDLNPGYRGSLYFFP